MSPYEPQYTWRSAIYAFCALITLAVIAITLAIMLSGAMEPLPYQDPEPPTTPQEVLPPPTQ